MYYGIEDLREIEIKTTYYINTRAHARCSEQHVAPSSLSQGGCTRHYTRDTQYRHTLSPTLTIHLA